jgi:hypothetical protein
MGQHWLVLVEVERARQHLLAVNLGAFDAAQLLRLAVERWPTVADAA